jgi:hypothetical protein
MEHLRNIELACASNWEALLAVRQSLLQEAGPGRGYPLRRDMHLNQRLPAIADYDAIRCRSVLETLTATLQVPTLRLNAYNRSRPDLKPEWRTALDELPDSVRERWEKRGDELALDDASLEMTFADWSLFLVGKMKEQGVPIAAGTDTPIRLAVPGESLHRELELLVQAGLTPREAIFAATVAPAEFFSLEKEMGQVVKGMRADLVLLRANPLVDIRHTRLIEGVLSRGEWLPSRAD